MARPARETAQPPEPEDGPVWQSPFDPLALPATDGLTLGQRNVLRACLGLFADRGYAASSIRDIGAAAGMQSASLYSHFPSKEAMLSELMVLGYEFNLDRTTAALLGAPTDPVSQLSTLVGVHIRVHCEYARLGIVISREQPTNIPAAVSDRVAAARARTSANVHEILRRGEEQGIFSVAGPTATVMSLASLGVDAARWFPYQREIGVEQLAQEYTELALRMVRAVAA